MKKQVLILGFSGAKFKHFKKLQDYYLSRGVDSIVKCTPLFCTHSAREEVMLNIEEAIKLWESPNFVVHLFSNTGYYTYVNLIQRGNICLPSRIVMDSAPYIPISTLQFHNSMNCSSNRDSLIEEDGIDLPTQMSRVATAMILQRNTYQLFPLTNILYIGLSLLDRTLGVFPQVQSLDNYYLSRHSQLSIPTLFIYSQGDKIIEAEKIRQVMRALKEKYKISDCNTIIQQKEFGPEVPHVKSFRMYEKDYSMELDKFLFNDTLT